MSVLTSNADDLGRRIIDAVRQEYPNAPRHVMRDADDRPTARDVHPAFYGCFDWHSAVEMHWSLIVLLRAAPHAAIALEARAVLAEHLTRRNLLLEAAYFDANPAYERPYGWGWLLYLADELADWAATGDADAVDWSANIRPLADVIEAGFVAWLPKPAYPDRSGMHGNSAFALSRALPWAWRRGRGGDPTLRDVIGDAAVRWFADDEDYSSALEPSGADFLSPALTELVLMAELLEPESFEDWFETFQGMDLWSDGLMRPARVTDADDGQGAHLHGLNLYRVHAFRRLRMMRAAEPVDAEMFDDLLKRHARAAAEAGAARGWMAEHWLVAYSMLASER